MKIFGLWITRKENYNQFVRLKIKEQKFMQVYRWFSGWKDLDIIWKYIFEDTNYGGIEKSRKDYAEARGTNEYGKIK